ncbi:MAG: bifunctional nuclease family protein [Actinomycetia bacterium]|nr:bifunctional nuclease family protein [Actinomycetes bacterium]
MLPVEVISLGLDPSTRTPVVLLSPVDGPALYSDRVMPIQIGGYEASALLGGIRGIRGPRPISHDLLSAIIEQSNLELLRVEIYDFREHVFYARLVFDIEGKENTLEARPSDAMALAARLKAPVFCDEHLFVENSLPKNAVHVHEGAPPTQEPLASYDPGFDSGSDAELDELDEEEIMGSLMNALGSLMEMFQASTGATGIGVDMRVMGMMPQFTARPQQPAQEVNEGEAQEFKSFLDNISPEDFS